MSENLGGGGFLDSLYVTLMSSDTCVAEWLCTVQRGRWGWCYGGREWMEDYTHGRLPLSTTQDSLLCHTWSVIVDRALLHSSRKLILCFFSRKSKKTQLFTFFWSGISKSLHCSLKPMYVYNISGLSSCVKDNKSDWVWYLGLKF